MLAKIYYRYCYLRDNPIARFATSIMRPKQMTMARWEDEYSSGDWDVLHDHMQASHNSVLLSFVERYPKSSILELGCGPGTLVPRLKRIGYGFYTGVDLSEVAIDRCEHLADETTEFIAADAETYVPHRKYDLIILNESIYYFVEPIESMGRYSDYLRPNGAFLLSIFTKQERNHAVARRLRELFEVKDETSVTTRGLTWEVMCISSLPQMRSSY